MKIVIVGGGTAGWLAALFISKIKPEHTVTVIESSAIGIVGAGEGSTGALMDVISNNIWNFGCDPVEFMRETSATVKYGIKHKGWTPDLDSHYFGPLDGTATGNHIPDGIFGLGSAMMPDQMHLATLYGHLIENNTSPINRISDRFEIRNHALHFDAHLVGQYFKKITMRDRPITLLDQKIVDVLLNNSGEIASLILDNNETIEGDFFIDASGFSRVLTSKLESKWISYRDHLPVNTAMPFFLDYKEGETPEPYTTAWAQSAGWMWQIPTQTRKGCGYVFCDKFITNEQAHLEIENALKQEIDPVRFLKFDTGRLENAWTKNCLAIGLNAAFAEPLEATSIHSTIVQLTNFVFEFLMVSKEDTISPAAITQYNNRTARMYDDFKDFLVAHYLGGRTDSEFWRHIAAGNTTTEFTQTIIDMCATKQPSLNDFNQYPGAAGWHLWGFVLDGIGKLPRGKFINSMNEFVIKDSVDRLEDVRVRAETLRLTNYSYNEFLEALAKDTLRF